MTTENTSSSTGRVVIVTGASRGIGAATARLFGSRGYAVVVNYLADAAKAETVVADIEAGGGRAMAIQGDVRDAAAVERIVTSAVDQYGGVHALVNNAMGVMAAKPVAESSWDDFQSQIDGAIKATLLCCQCVIPLMEQQGGGAIINVGSTYALGVPPAKMAAYVTAKAGLIGLTRALAVECAARKIRVNMVSPSPVDTDLWAGVPPRMKDMMAAQHPMKRLGRPEDVAEAVYFLASEASAYVAGTNLIVSGGQVV